MPGTPSQPFIHIDPPELRRTDWPMKPGYQFYLSDDLTTELEATASKSDAPKSAVISQALRHLGATQLIAFTYMTWNLRK